MHNKRVPKARRSGLVVQKANDELLVFDIAANRAHCLNGTMAAVWSACDGTRTISEIASSFENALDTEEGESIVWLAIDELHQHKLLEGNLEPGVNGQSRREMIKKIGFASAIAIPVIASLAAPSSALAAVSCSCLMDFDCIGGCPSTCNVSGGVCN